jgi:ATP-binding cassette subfamily F protein 3
LIQFRNLALARGARSLIEDASLQIHAGWRVGLAGPNGSGKSSLFALLRGELHADRGDCELPAGWRIASVAQETPALDQPAIEYVLDGDAELRAVERELARAEAAHDGHRVGELHARGRLRCWPGSVSPTRISRAPSRVFPAAGACG